MHENILDALRRGAHDEALALARQATEADPGDARGHRLMAQALRLSGDQRGAVKAIDRAIAIAAIRPLPAPACWAPQGGRGPAGLTERSSWTPTGHPT